MGGLLLLGLLGARGALLVACREVALGRCRLLTVEAVGALPQTLDRVRLKVAVAVADRRGLGQLYSRLAPLSMAAVAAVAAVGSALTTTTTRERPAAIRAAMLHSQMAEGAVGPLGPLVQRSTPPKMVHLAVRLREVKAVAGAVADVTAQQQQPAARVVLRAAVEPEVAADRTQRLAATVDRARWAPATS